MEYYTLNNGVKMPKIGFGTYAIPPEKTEECVLNAIQAGYRMIDTASAYYNEEGVGRAIKKCGVPREQLFIATKLWVQDMGYENTKKAFETSLKKLQLDYVDLYLIHQPFGDIYGSYRAMEELYESGKIKAIGVCNFYADRLVDLIINNRITPAVLQIEYHPLYQRKEEVKYAKEYNVQLQAWASLGQGKSNIIQNPIILNIAKSHNKTPAQVLLRWAIQNGAQVIPRTIHKERLIENRNIFDFELTQSEMEEIAKLDGNKTLFLDKRDPSKVKRYYDIKVHD